MHYSAFSEWSIQNPGDFLNVEAALGKFHELKGKTKQGAGQVTNNPTLEAEGQAEKLAGSPPRPERY